MYENDKIVCSGKLTVISNFKGIKSVPTPTNIFKLRTTS